MKTLYIECSMGAAGDMLMGALYELIDDRQGFLDKMNSLGIPGVRVEAEPSIKCGIAGTHMKVTIEGKEEHEHNHEDGHRHHHDHSSLHSISHMVSHMDIKEETRDKIMKVYRLIAEAEGAVHNRPAGEIHFHEVGSLDAVADIAGVCILMDMIRPDEVCVSPVHTGSGHVHCAHGILPVPAPATAHILRGIPVYGGEVEGELCTPTGAALLKVFADSFGAMPLMKISGTGYGMGTADFERANCVRAFLGEDDETGDEIYELECSIDDMTPEEISYAAKKILEEGALDVYTQSILMKKGRPGFLLTILCRKGTEDSFAKLIFENTSTIGIRRRCCERYLLTRHMETENGMRVKVSEGYGVTRRKTEFEDREKKAEEKNTGILEVR